MLASPRTFEPHSVLSTPHITIATRESRLALWQAHHVQSLLKARGFEVDILGMTTQGDQILDRSLSKVGGMTVVEAASGADGLATAAQLKPVNA